LLTVKDSAESVAASKPQEIDAKQRKRMQSSCSERSDAKTAGCGVRLFGLAERGYGDTPYRSCALAGGLAY